MRKLVFHRGYSIENSTGDPAEWKVRLKGKVVQGKLAPVKKSIDWWCDTKTLIDPDKLEEKEEKKLTQKIEKYQGINIINDTGDDKEWYLFLRGRLFKGSLPALKNLVDKYIEKLNSQ